MSYLTRWQQLQKDYSLSAMIAGLLAVIISYSGPLVIVFQAGQAASVSPSMIASWVWAISIGSALPSMYLSWRYQKPVLLAWSIPGTALLISLFPELPLSDMVGAYLVTAVITLIIGITGYFDKLLAWIPQGVAAGMMAGILFQFGVGIFQATQTMPVVAFIMLAVYVLFRRIMPRYAIVWVLVVGICVSLMTGHIHSVSLDMRLTTPQLIMPTFSWSAMINLALPLVLLNLTGQFLPGMALMKLNHYPISSKPILTTASLSSIVVAFFGGISIVQAAVTAALCMGDNCHDDPKRRYVAGIANGMFYLLGGLFAASLVGLFHLLPKAMIATLAGLALLNALMSNLTIAMQQPHDKEAALITFLATVSGMKLLGLGAVFWGIVVGMASYAVLHAIKRPTTP